MIKKSKSLIETNHVIIRKLQLYLHLISRLSLVLFLFPIQFQKRDKELFFAFAKRDLESYVLSVLCLQ